LQTLLHAISKLNKDDMGAIRLDVHINTYLQEAKHINTKIDNESDCEGSEHTADADDNKCIHAGGKVSDGNSNNGNSNTKCNGLRAYGYKEVQFFRGEALIQEGHTAENLNHLEEAYEKYCQGLQFIFEVMPRFGKSDMFPVREIVRNYLERAEQVKGRLEGAAAAGSSHDGKRQGAQSMSRSGSSGAGRSRSRKSHHHR